MTIKGSDRANQMLRWFFNSEDSRYELAEVTRIAQTTKDNIQNWVRREMIEPDEVTPGRRVYAPLTVADIKVATILLEQYGSPTNAFMAARVVNVVTMSWFAGHDWKDGDPMPAFRRDVRQQFAALWWGPRSLHDPHRIPYVEIVHGDELNKFLRKRGPILHTPVPIGRYWIDLADFAWRLKQRQGKRLEPQGEDEAT